MKLSRRAWLSLGVFASTLAHADYFYRPYYGRQQSEPIISLTLDPQESLNSDLRIAAREDRIDQMKRILKQGANINGLSSDGKSALMYASSDCSVEAGRMLLLNHAIFNLQDKEGKTALMYAAMASCSPIVSLLTRKPRIDVRTRDKSGRSALDYALDGASLYVQGPPVISLHLIEKALSRSGPSTKRIAVNEKR
jgi:hypothetical protein